MAHSSRHSPAGLARFLREPANAITHMVGVALAVAGAVVLLRLSAGDPMQTVAVAIYGGSLVLLYTASTLLHGVRGGPATVRRLRIFDHAAIFGLIAGTYTPIALLLLRDTAPAWGWTLFAVAWGFALLGVLFTIAWPSAPRWLSTALYLGLGWLAVGAIAPLTATLSAAGLAWLLAGGVAYSVGALVYATRRPDPWPRTFGHHALWHLFVLAGSACHYVLVLTELVLA